MVQQPVYLPDILSLTRRLFLADNRCRIATNMGMVYGMRQPVCDEGGIGAQFQGGASCLLKTRRLVPP
jgi:hypothetical protein